MVVDGETAMNLYCSVCHTYWEELVLKSGDKCPFMDCAGHLSESAPTKPTVLPFMADHE